MRPPPSHPGPTVNLDAPEAEERRRQLWALPASLLGAHLLVGTSAGHALGRIFLSMWVHEAGHAVTAWLCGHAAFPGPWRTPVSEDRSALCVVLVLAASAWLSREGLRTGRKVLLGGGLGLAGVAGLCTFGLSHDHAQALILFGGDAGLFVLGTAAMASFYAGAETALARQGLRWGFLVIGAVAFMDGGDTWWAAGRDPDRIPFGENEGVGASDPTRLVEEHGWTVHMLVSSYLWLSVVCALSLAGLYLFFLLRERPRGGGFPSVDGLQ